VVVLALHELRLTVTNSRTGAVAQCSVRVRLVLPAVSTPSFLYRGCSHQSILAQAAFSISSSAMIDRPLYLVFVPASLVLTRMRCCPSVVVSQARARQYFASWLLQRCPSSFGRGRWGRTPRQPVGWYGSSQPPSALLLAMGNVSLELCTRYRHVVNVSPRLACLQC
jgi:hypothetical protein